MFSSKMPGFRKSEGCPSSHELLEFQNGDMPRTRGGEISRHLPKCEFCAAEVEFYSYYPQEEGVSEATQIPAPLFELAEALLKIRHGDSSSLDSLLREKGGVVKSS